LGDFEFSMPPPGVGFRTSEANIFESNLKVDFEALRDKIILTSGNVVGSLDYASWGACRFAEILRTLGSLGSRSPCDLFGEFSSMY
jgi:hypothetical protein